VGKPQGYGNLTWPGLSDVVRTSRGPRQNGVRPAANPLFRSAALVGGPRTIGVVLSGTLDDAALGSATVEQRGGRVIVQDPVEASYDSMPRCALAVTKHAEIQPIGKLSYGCAAGHRWSPQALLEQQTDAVQRALWLAIRSLDERGRLTEGLAESARQRGHALTAARFQDASKEARLAADVIRNAASGMNPVTEAPDTDEPFSDVPVTD
jgi:two-component system chemotaxis response regulator CheB